MCLDLLQLLWQVMKRQKLPLMHCSASAVTFYPMKNVTLMPTGSVAKQQNVDTSRIETETIRGPLNPLQTQPNPPIPAPILTPQAPPVPPLPQKKPDDKQDTSESTDSQSTSMDTNLTSNKKKGTLVTRSFALPWRAKPVRLFKCGVCDCNQVFGSVKDLNQHHQDNHPLAKCDICTGQFSWPNEML